MSLDGALLTLKILKQTPKPSFSTNVHSFVAQITKHFFTLIRGTKFGFGIENSGSYKWVPTLLPNLVYPAHHV